MFVSWRLEFSRGPLCRRMCFQSHGRFILFGRRAEHCHVKIPWNQWLVIFCRPECIRRESKFVKTDLGNLVLCFVTWCCVWFEENESNCRNRSIGLKSETEENGKCRSKIDRHPLGNSLCCVWLSTCLAATFFQSVCLSDVVGFARRWVPVQTLGKIYPVQEVRTAWTKLIEGRVLKTKEVRPVRQLWNLRPGMSVFVDQGGIQTLSLARWPKRWTWRLALGNRLQWSRLTWAVVLILSCDWLLLFFGSMEAATKMKAVKVMKRKREAGVNSITGTLQIIVSWIFQAKKRAARQWWPTRPVHWNSPHCSSLQNPVRCRKATSKALASSKQTHWFGRAETGKLWRWENSIFSEGTGIEFFQLSRNVFRWSQMCPFCFVLCVIRILFQVAHHGWISGRKIYSVKLPLGRVQPLEWKVVGAQAFRVSNGFKCFVWCQHEQVSNNKTGGKKKSGAQLFVGEKVFRSFSSIR